MSTKRFKVRHASEAFKEAKPIDWIVNPLFSAGSVSILHGGCVGKTFSLLDCCTCVATGKHWLDFETTKGGALIVDWQSGARRLHRRMGDSLRGHNAGKDTPIAYITFPDINLRSNQGMHTLLDVVKQNNFKFIVLDSLLDSLFYKASFEEYRRRHDHSLENATNRLFRLLRYIATVTDSAIVCTHYSDATHWLYDKAGAYREFTAIDTASTNSAVNLILECERYEFRIEKLDLSPKTLSPLKRAGITSVTEVLDHMARGDEAMMSIKGFGVGSLSELKHKVESNTIRGHNILFKVTKACDIAKFSFNAELHINPGEYTVLVPTQAI